MRNSKFRKVSLLAASILAVSTISVAAAGLVGCDSDANVPPVAVAAEITNSSSLPANTVMCGTVATLPESVQVSYNGANYTASGCKVTSPDGLTKNAAGELAFIQMGRYTLRYFFTDSDNVQRNVQHIVNVTDSYFSLSSGNEATYIKTNNESTLHCGKDGISVELTEGTTFTYNKPIDLRNASEDGLTDIIEVDARIGTMATDAEGNQLYDPIADILWVQVTDAYNPNLSMTIRMGRHSDYNGAYMIGVKTSYQSLVGLDAGSEPIRTDTQRYVYIDDVKYLLWPDEKGYANSGLPNIKSAMTTGISWRYDYEKMRLYWSYNGSKDNMLTDLDEALIYDNGTFFPGWTTGEVFVSVYAEGYHKDTAKAEIMSIGGSSVHNLVNEPYSDTVKPTITVLQDKTTDSGIKAAVGDVVTIPQAKADDVNLIGSVEAAVYTNYGTPYQTAITVTNGKFTPTQAAEYTIEYTAKDGSGNVGTATFNVLAVNTTSNKSITLTPMNPTADDLKIGIPFNVQRTVESALNVEADDIDVTLNITHNGEPVSVNRDGTFIPLIAGTYKISYVYSDGIFSYNDEHEYEFTPNTATTFVENVLMPKYFVKGLKYSLGDLCAYSFGTGAPIAENTQVYAVYDGGAETLVDQNAVQITGNNSVYFVFKSGSAVQRTATAQIVDASLESGNGIAMEKLFLGDFTANAVNDKGARRTEIMFKANKNGDSKLSFVNQISTRSFAIDYFLREATSNMTGFRLIFTDVEDATKTYTMTFEKGGAPAESSTVSFNGKPSQTLTRYPFYSANQKTISYEHATHKLLIGDTTFFEEISIPSGKCYFDIEFLGVSGDAAISVRKINNQNIFGTLYKDNAEPQIYVDTKQGLYTVGDEVTLSVPEISDVFSGIDYARTEFSIYCSDGSPVLDKNGNALTNLKWDESYTVKLDRMGRYTVAYVVYDFGGESANFEYVLNCVDLTAPTINVEDVADGGVIHVKVGNQIIIRFNVSDDQTPTNQLVTYMHISWDSAFQFIRDICGLGPNNIAEDGRYEARFTLTIKGEYTAIIQVWDANGNIATKRIQIVVE